jgi:indole-3-glycerol phosphate synthase
MHDFLDTLAMDAVGTIESGYYQNLRAVQQPKVSLKQAILNCRTNSVVTEIKAASPSLGTIRENFDPKAVALAMEKAGAVGISVLTEPKHFNGSLDTLSKVRAAVNLPLLMKDIVIVADQIEAATKLGANAVLLIEALFERGCCEMSVERMIAYAHNQGLEVLLETHTEAEFQKAIETDADLIGINNRNLTTLKIDLNTTQQILRKHPNHEKNDHKRKRNQIRL